MSASAGSTAAPTFVSEPGGCLQGAVRVPGDKSITHRALMFGAIAEGETRIHRALRGEDCLATEAALRQLGADISVHDDGQLLIVQGQGDDALRGTTEPLDLGNSGTGMRLMAGLLVGRPFESVLVGDSSLSKRPMERVAGPLRQMGADIDTQDGCPPVTIRANAPGALRALRYEMPMASAQVKSAVLIAGLRASGETSVVEPAITRDHTERMLHAFGAVVRSKDGVASVQGLDGKSLQGQSITVPSDISSAAFFLVAASVCPRSDLLLEGVGTNPTRTGILDALALLGANITRENERLVGGEPVADLRVRSASLRGARIPEHLVPLAIDELPVLFVAAALAEGETLITGAAELRVKESDRLAAMADGLQRLGVELELLSDGMRIRGRSTLNGGEVDSFGDHRIAMAFAVAGQRAADVVRIRDTANVATSFPDFLTLAQHCGWRVANRGA
ncbi:MAG: 3-phosphoshikimate 1-carboxyvinyltransferase [Pseudomonadota bacterium]